MRAVSFAGKCDLVVLHSGDVLHDALPVGCPRVDAEGEVSSRCGHLRPLLPQSSTLPAVVARECAIPLLKACKVKKPRPRFNNGNVARFPYFLAGMRTTQQDYDDHAAACSRAAEQTDDPVFRRILLMLELQWKLAAQQEISVGRVAKMKMLDKTKQSDRAPNPNEKPETCYCSALPKGSGLCLPCYTRWLARRRS